MKSVKSPGLRERKAAKLKLELLRIAIEAMSDIPFKDVRVEDLCEKATISKVTFFNYFPAKENLMDYFTAVWYFKMYIRFHQEGLEGLQALRSLFREMAEKLNSSNYAYTSIISHISDSHNQRNLPELSKAEKMELFPHIEGLAEIETISFGTFLQKHVKLAIEKKEISDVLSVYDLTGIIGALFYGSGLIGLRVSYQKPGDFFIRNFENLIYSLNTTNNNENKHTD